MQRIKNGIAMTDNEFIKMEADDRPILWSDIKGYEGFYRVSTDGQVQSVERVREYLNATIKSRILRQSPNPKGYLMVKLYKDGDKKTFPVHRLVAQAFIPNPQNKPQIDHIDGNTKNNNVTNLRWATNKENSNNPVTLVNRIGRPSHLKGKKVRYTLVLEEEEHCVQTQNLLYQSQQLIFR